MHKLSATFALVTPLFSGGADPQTSAELRPPSIKGVLRFWWRALAWSRCNGHLPKIRAEEARIFGAAGDRDSGAGQASFLLRVRETPGHSLSVGQVLNGSDGNVVGDGARYFGYGLMAAFGAKKGELTRPCLRAPFEFDVELVSKPRRAPAPEPCGVDEDKKAFDPSLVDALKLMGLLGGLGSRTRRGWGSLSLRSLQGDTEPWQAPADPGAYKAALQTILRKPLPVGEPPYSAFCDQTRIEIVDENTDPLRLLNTVGEEMLRYRSWGRNGRVLGEESEKNFESDHDWFKTSERVPSIESGQPRRAIFGLPHNYSQKFHITTSSYDRRASPLLVHIHRISERSCIAVLTVMRSAFLPAAERLKVTNGRAESNLKPAPDWDVLDAFIARFDSRQPVLP